MASTLKAEIEAANQKFMDAFRKQDSAAIGAIYTEDCKVMPPGMDVVTGQEAAANVFGTVMKMGASTVKLEVDEVGTMETNTVFERSHYTFYKDKGETEILDHGKYVVIWKKINGKLAMYVDIFNSNNSPS